MGTRRGRILMPGIVVIGAGGHAKVCIELLHAMGKPVACCIGGEGSGDTCLGIHVRKGDDHDQLAQLRHEGHELAFVAIGSNSLRFRLATLARQLGYQLVNAISPAATISPSAKLGNGVAIMAGAVINADTVIGDLAIINTCASVDHDGVIGEAVHIAPQCGLAGNVSVAMRTFLGIGSQVIPGVSIGSDVVAGAGSIIIADVANSARIAGVPAKTIRKSGGSMNRISVAQPKLEGNERKYVLDCLDTNWISSNGKYIGAFEEAFAAFCGVKYAVAANNGTTALHLALVALDLQPGDEVIIPTVTYIATANAVRYCGATPVLVDVCADTMNIDPAQIERKITPRTKGIIPVHLYGHPADMTALQAIAERHGLWVLEDAAEAHGAEVNGKRVGALGNCATFSFFGNKIVTTGEGGMVTTNDDELAAKLRLYRGQGVDPKRRYWFPVIGYNYRMTNIQAAIGLAQMETIDKALEERRLLAQMYDQALMPLKEALALPTTHAGMRHVYWMYTVFLRDGGEVRRDAVMRALDDDGIETRPVFYPMHVLPPYFQDNAYPVADEWAQRGMNLPTHGYMTREDVERIAASLSRALAQ